MIIKRIISVVFVLILCSNVSFMCAQTLKTEEEQLDSIVNELRELGAKQECIDDIPLMTEEEYRDLAEYSKSLSDSIDSEGGAYNAVGNKKSKKLSFSEFLENNPTIATGTAFFDIIGWSFLLIIGIVGLILSLLCLIVSLFGFIFNSPPIFYSVSLYVVSIIYFVCKGFLKTDEYKATIPYINYYPIFAGYY